MSLVQYTNEEREHLVAYIAVNYPSRRNRQGNKLYQQLVEKEEWAKSRSWSSWRGQYKNHRDEFDRWIAAYQDEHNIARSRSPSPSQATPQRARSVSRTRYTSEEDEHLVAFLAEMAPLKVPGKHQSKFGRMGNYVYRVILSEPDDYLWGLTHTWQSWRERYVKNKARFDKRIDKWQEDYGIDPEAQIKVVRDMYGKNRIREVAEEQQQEKGQPDEQEEQQLDNRRKTRRSGIKRSRPRDDDGQDDGQSTDNIVRSAKKRQYMIPKPIRHSPSVDLEERVETPPPVESLLRPAPNIPTTREGPNDDNQVEQHHGDYVEIELSGINGRESQISQNHVTQGNVSMSPNPKEILDQTPPSPQTLNAPQSLPDVSSLSVGHTDRPGVVPEGHPKFPPQGSEIERTPRHVQVSAVHSHPPTPPPTNIQSEGSTLSLSLEPEAPKLTVVAKAKQRSSITPSRSPILPSGAHSRDESNVSDQPRSILEHPGSSDPTPKALAKSLQTVVASRSPLFRSSSPSISDGPFATCSPSPRRTEIIRGLPKLRERSFRNNDRVRPRNVVLGQHSKPHEYMQGRRIEDWHEDGALWPPVNGKLNGSGHGFQVPPQPGSSSSTNIMDKPGRIKTPISVQDAQPAVSSNVLRRRTHRVGPPTLKVPSNTPLFTVVPSKTNNPDSTDKLGTFQLAIQTDDVFANTKPIPSSTNHDPYVLRTSHLPSEPSTASTLSRVQESSPVPHSRTQRDRNRRRTFAGFGLSRGLPDINLLAELQAKNARSRSPGVIWTRGSPDITILSKPDPAPSRQLLSDTERAVARRGPSRKSVVPILVDSEAGSTTPVSLDQLSPSTSGIIIQEGLAAIFKRMERNHGFSIDVVRRTWLHQNKDLRATDAKLLRMRMAAEVVANSDEDDNPPRRSSLTMGWTPEQVQKLEERTRIKGQSTSTAEDVPRTNYTPPVRSRAGHYRRFLEQGRHLEARQREIDLVGRLPGANLSLKMAPVRPAAVPIWSEKDDEVLRAASEDGLRVLVEKFGEKVLRQKSLALMELDE